MSLPLKLILTHFFGLLNLWFFLQSELYYIVIDFRFFYLFFFSYILLIVLCEFDNSFGFYFVSVDDPFILWIIKYVYWILIQNWKIIDICKHLKFNKNWLKFTKFKYKNINMVFVYSFSCLNLKEILERRRKKW